MKIIHLVRHGQKHSHSGDPGLTDTGMKQADQTGKYLSQFPISQIVSSPFKRTLETAEQVAKHFSVSPTTDDFLVERMNWESGAISRDDFIAEWIKSTHDRMYQPKWGDSSFQTGTRLSQVIDNLNLLDNQHAVLVTHGGAIADYLRNTFDEALLEALHKHYPEGIDFQVLNCSITSIVFDDSPNIQRINFVEHLDDVSE